MALVRPSSFTVLCMLLSFFFFFNDTATTEIYTLSLHDALPIPPPRSACPRAHRSWSYPDVPLRGAASRPALRTLTCVAVDPQEVLSRPAPAPDATVAYGSGPEQVADVRLPPTVDGPLVVFLHGGFWRAAWDRTHTGPLAADLAARGYPVACPEYPRTRPPRAGWPGTFHDVLAA